MSIANISLSIRNHFYTEWGSATPFQIDDEDFDKPDDDWVRLSIKHGEQNKNELNSNSYNVPGLVILQYFSKPDKKMIEREQRVDALCAIFRGAAFGGITFDGPSPDDRGVIDGWRQFNINVTFSTDIFY